ncbi:hypothetical protein CL176_11245 [Suicoccus acidiformans]|uniref:Transporter n=1 Tax=Suicoccus acidiformans TaxID=2036206 RepID=A0A347WN67_9LACT|nr:mechanosensitive ion channel [Suicoccus acidiformans]AXY26524.1 hypothetical protein CL176_11245 [Suicoccus acidiformans]
METFLKTVMEELPGLVGAVSLLVLALIVAWFVKRSSLMLMSRFDFRDKFQAWGIAKSESEAKALSETVASLLYFLVLLLFLPSILSGLNIGRELDSLQQLFRGIVSYIPNILLAVVIFSVGLYFCSFIRRISQNLFEGLNLDVWIAKVTGQAKESVSDKRLAEVLASVVYVLLFIPILTLSMETLGIEAISKPILSLLNQLLAFMPKLFVAIILLIFGGFLARLLGDLVEGLLKTSGIDRYSQYLNVRGEASINISQIIGASVKIILFLFFLVESISVMELEVLNLIGKGVIAYLPSVISAVMLMSFGFITANVLAQFLKRVYGSYVIAEIARYIVLGLAIFMTLDQLQIAQRIVNASFIIILSALAVTFALAFGLGGRDFAAKQLEHLDKVIHDAEQDATDKADEEAE